VTTLLFVNREEAMLLLRKDSHTPIKELLSALKTTGPQTVVITDGADGAYAFDGQTYYQMGIYDGPVVERTGCGDAFGTAFTVAIAEGKSITEALQWGNANSTSVLAYVGPEAGLLSQIGIEAMVAKNQSVQPMQI
jgi:ribokinase